MTATPQTQARTTTPAVPSPPPPPASEAADRAEFRRNLTQTIEDAQAAARDAQGAARDAQARAGTAQGREAAGRINEELDQARALARQIGGGTAASGGAISVVRDNAGRVVVTGRDGRTITIDPKAGLSEDATQDIIQTALAPVPIPRTETGPPMPFLIVTVVLFFLTLMVVGFPMARAWGRRVDRRGGDGATSPETAQRLARIEQAVEAVAIEVERISEAQRYSARLLTERLPESMPTLGAMRQEVGPNG